MACRQLLRSSGVRGKVWNGRCYYPCNHLVHRSVCVTPRCRHSSSSQSLHLPPTAPSAWKVGTEGERSYNCSRTTQWSTRLVCRTRRACLALQAGSSPSMERWANEAGTVARVGVQCEIIFLRLVQWRGERVHVSSAPLAPPSHRIGELVCEGVLTPRRALGFLAYAHTPYTLLHFTRLPSLWSRQSASPSLLAPLPNVPKCPY